MRCASESDPRYVSTTVRSRDSSSIRPAADDRPRSPARTRRRPAPRMWREVLLDEHDRVALRSRRSPRSPRRRRRSSPARGPATARRSAAERAGRISPAAERRPAAARRPRACGPSDRGGRARPGTARRCAAARRGRWRQLRARERAHQQVLLDRHLGEQAVALHDVHDAACRDRLGRAARRPLARRARSRRRAGRSSPLMTRSSVVLPWPLGPITTAVVPSVDLEVDAAHHDASPRSRPRQPRDLEQQRGHERLPPPARRGTRR